MSFRRKIRRSMERQGKVRREVLETRSTKKISEFFKKYPAATITYVPVSNLGGKEWNARCVAWLAVL